MKKRVMTLFLLLSFMSPAAVFAGENYGQVQNDKIAFAGDGVMKDLVKDALYSVGTKILDKYANRNNNYNYQEPNYNSNSNNNYDPNNQNYNNQNDQNYNNNNYNADANSGVQNNNGEVIVN